MKKALSLVFLRLYFYEISFFHKHFSIARKFYILPVHIIHAITVEHGALLQTIAGLSLCVVPEISKKIQAGWPSRFGNLRRL